MESVGLDMDDIFGAEADNNQVDIGAEQNPFEATEDPEEANTFDANTSAKLAKGAAKKVVRNPQPKLDPQRLTGQRGIAILPKLFENVKFKGKGHEAEDLEKVIKGFEHWAHRLFPKRTFEECLQTIEKLGNKGEVKTCIKKIRLDMPVLDEDFVSKPDEDVGNTEMDEINEAENAFDEMMHTSISSQSMSTSNSQIPDMFSPPSHPSYGSTPKKVLSDELKEKIERNRRLALERRTQKLQNQTLQSQDIPISIPSSQDEVKPSQVAETHSSSTKQNQVLDSLDEPSSAKAEVVTSVNNESMHSNDDAEQVPSFGIDTSKAVGKNASPIQTNKDTVPSVDDEPSSDDKKAETPGCDNSVGIDTSKVLGEDASPIPANSDAVPPIDDKASSNDKKVETSVCDNSVGIDTSKVLASPNPANNDTVLPVDVEASSDDKKAETSVCENSVLVDTSKVLGEDASPIPANNDTVPPVDDEASSDDKKAETPVCENTVGIDTSKVLGDNASPIPGSKDMIPPVDEVSSDDKKAEVPVCDNSGSIETSVAVGENTSSNQADCDTGLSVGDEPSSDDKKADAPVCDESCS